MIYLILNNIRYYAGRIFAILLNIVLVYFVFHFTQSHIKIGEQNIYSLLYRYDREIEWWFYLIVFIIIISVINIFILILLSVYFNFRRNRNQSIINRYEPEIIENILKYTFPESHIDSDSEDEYCQALSMCTKAKRLVEIFFTDMIKIQDMVDEDLSIKYSNLIQRLTLKKYIVRFLYSRKLSEKIISLKVISCLKLRGYEQLISRYSISKNYILRIAALETLIKLSETDHLSMLLSHEKYISKLDINIIISGVEKNRKADIDYFSLIRSASPRIAMTGLLLIKSRNKVEFKELIKPHLESSDSTLRASAWEVFTFFAVTEEDFILMRQKFNNEPQHIRLMIVKSLRSFFQNKDVPGFLDEVIRKEGILLKIEALKIIFEKNVNHFMAYQSTGDRSIDAAYNEIVDLNLG